MTPPNAPGTFEHVKGKPTSLRIVFMGTPDFSTPALSELIRHGHDVVAVYTRAPRPAGRGMGMRRSPVHTLAETSGIPVLTPASLRTAEASATFERHRADVAVVIAYGMILPKPVLEAPAHGCINLHASLLPRWRGAAPIQRAIMAGDTCSGVMTMQMDMGLDTGPVGMTERVAIEGDMTAGDLQDRLSHSGADLLVRSLASLERGRLSFEPQDVEGVTYASKIGKTECRVDWRQPATCVHNHIRGLSPFPGAYLEVDLGRGLERVKVLRSQIADAHGPAGEALDDRLTIGCGAGAVRLMQVQRAGKAPMGADEFLRGARLVAGTRLA